MGLGGLVLGFPLLYLKGMRIMMFQLSSFYCKGPLRYPRGSFRRCDRRVPFKEFPEGFETGPVRLL